MKTKLRSYLTLFAAMAMIITACRKDKNEIPESSLATQLALTEEEHFPELILLDSLLNLENNAAIPFPLSGKYNCNLTKPIYKETLLFNKSGSENDFIVKPDYNPGAGKYYSWPKGLVIDSLTGEINVSASQGGTRYAVGYVKKGSRDTCLQDIVLAGASYMDSVYVLGKNDTVAAPYFNANLAAAPICDASGDEDYPDNSGHGNGNDKCEFDAADNKGKKGRANEKKVRVRTISGLINLKKTLEEGAFGTTTPANGQGLVVPVYYKLADAGNKALQKVNVQLIFFNKQSDIPVALLNYIERKRASIRSGKLISPQGDPRPPLIVITRS